MKKMIIALIPLLFISLIIGGGNNNTYTESRESKEEKRIFEIKMEFRRLMNIRYQTNDEFLLMDSLNEILEIYNGNTIRPRNYDTKRVVTNKRLWMIN